MSVDLPSAAILNILINLRSISIDSLALSRCMSTNNDCVFLSGAVPPIFRIFFLFGLIALGISLFWS